MCSGEVCEWWVDENDIGACWIGVDVTVRISIRKRLEGSGSRQEERLNLQVHYYW
jgi:hypothetical protein